MSHAMIIEFLYASWQTLYMTCIAGLIAVICGFPLGILMLTTRSHHILANRPIQFFLNSMINAARSIPFIILLVAIIPFTRWITGTSIGTTAAIVPLSIAAIPFVARQIEAAMMEVPSGLIEAGLAMGATPWQIITKILIPEAMPGIIQGITIILISLLGYSAMAGAIGGGGLGDLAIRYGYYRFEVNIMIATILILIVMVQLLQWLGDCLSRQFSHHQIRS